MSRSLHKAVAAALILHNSLPGAGTVPGSGSGSCKRGTELGAKTQVQARRVTAASARAEGLRPTHCTSVPQIRESVTALDAQ